MGETTRMGISSGKEGNIVIVFIVAGTHDI
jgi:hypothetical protein